MAMNNVDIKITQNGWTKVPIVEMNKLKVSYSRSFNNLANNLSAVCGYKLTNLFLKIELKVSSNCKSSHSAILLLNFLWMYYYYQSIIDEASEEYLRSVAQEKLTSNLKFYQSLNTRKPRSHAMHKRLKETMVVYSAASKNNRGKVNSYQLERALAEKVI